MPATIHEITAVKFPDDPKTYVVESFKGELHAILTHMHEQIVNMGRLACDIEHMLPDFEQCTWCGVEAD